MNWLILLVAVVLSAGCVEESSLPFLAEKTTTSTSTTTTTTTSTSTTTSTTLEPVIELMVHLQDFQAKPAKATITQYNGVTWRNLDPVAHNLNFGSFSSGPIAPGKTYTHVFNETGTYHYSCSIHKRYMQGTITVK